MSDTPETHNERTLKLALEVFTELANTLKQERDEARQQYDNLATEHMLTMNKLAEERDEAVAARKASAADWLLQVENADRRVSEAKKMAARAVQDAAALADKLSGLELHTTEELARLEQERNEDRALADEFASFASHWLGSHMRKSPANFIKIAAALKRWKKSK
jgi:hypothetical protein